jgi:hypothetical protein
MIYHTYDVSTYDDTIVSESHSVSYIHEPPCNVSRKKPMVMQRYHVHPATWNTSVYFLSRSIDINSMLN